MKVIAVGGMAGLGIKLGLDSWAKTKTLSETRLLMGTIVNLTVIHPNVDEARTAMYSCFDRMEKLEALLSRHQPQSQLSQLNRLGKLINPDHHVMDLIKQSRSMSELSKGAFDITIKPVLDAIQAGRIPTAEERDAVGYQNLSLSNNQITFLKSGMGITLDGIAKGYIVDRGVEILKEYGFENILVEAGGDLVAKGQRSDGEAWHLGVAHPRSEKGGRYLSAFSLRDRAAATSGDYQQYYQDDKSQHHIIDPITRISPRELAAVTVLAPDALTADALSTTIMVLGVQAGLQLANDLPGVEALLVGKDLQTFKSLNFPG